jgi:hypothetical protein
LTSPGNQLIIGLVKSASARGVLTSTATSQQSLTPLKDPDTIWKI